MQLVAQVPSDSHRPALDRVSKMPMATGLTNLPPAVGFDEHDDGTYLHGV